MRPSSLSARAPLAPADEYREKRRQPRPSNTYLIVESGGCCGNSYRLELPLPRRWFWPWVRTRSVVLEGQEGQQFSWDDLMGQARAQVASVYGDGLARQARFQVLWDGSL